MKNFNVVYENVYKEVKKDGKYEKLESLRLESVREERKKEVARVARTVKIYILLAIIVFGPKLFHVLKEGEWQGKTFLIMIIIVAISEIKKEKKKHIKGSYRSKFQEWVVSPLINSLGEGLEYYPNGNLLQEICDRKKFNSCSKCKSEDLIIGKIDNKQELIIAQVTYERVDNEGDVRETTHLYGNIKCTKSIGTSILILRRNEEEIRSSVVGKKIEMDSTEFEKQYDVYAENKIVAMQILTAEIMQTLIDFSENNKIKYSLMIEQDHIDIMLYTGAIFDPKNFKEVLDYDMLKGYYDIVDFVLKLGREINKAIEEADI